MKRRGSLLSAVFLALPTLLAAQEPAFDRGEFAARRGRLFDQIGQGTAVVFGSPAHPHSVRFRQTPDFFYLTGIEEPGSILVLDGRTRRAVVLAPRRPQGPVSIDGPGVREHPNAEAHYGVTLRDPEGFWALMDSVAPGADTLFLPLTPHDELQLARFEVLMRERAQQNHPIWGGPTPVARAIERLRGMRAQKPVADLSPRLDRMRWIKTPYEIERMRTAGRVGAEGVKEAMKGTRPGMHEYELEAAARYVYVRAGMRGDAFIPIVASGRNTLTLHYIENNRRMEAGDLVYMDYGADADYYTSDITRTWPVSGRFTPEQERMYRTVLEARNAIIAAMKPGVRLSQLKDAAAAVYERYGYGENFRQFGRYVGHPVGMSVHDVEPGRPGADFVLEAGVVYNVEPLLHFPEKGVHLRLEDSVLVTATGAENLTAGVPVEIEEIYALIRQRPISHRGTEARR
jgi:Xaa-Pro aminopeptidase